jgi:hypothetical protein
MFGMVSERADPVLLEIDSWRLLFGLKNEFALALARAQTTKLV